MNNKTESEKLSGYSEALSKLEPDEQLKKMKAVTSPKTIKRFLSEDAPDELVHRFSFRLAEAIKEPLSDYELGRIMLERHDYNRAQAYMDMALITGDQRAYYFLGLLESAKGNIQEAVAHFKMSVASNFRLEKAMVHIADLALIDNNPEKELDEQVKKGDKESGMAMLSHYTSLNDYDGMEKVAEHMIKKGYLGMYQSLAVFFKEHGETERAIVYFKKALKAGHEDVYPNLIMTLHETGNDDEAIELCIEALSKGIHEAYLPLFTFLEMHKRYGELLQYISHALYNGHEPAKFLLKILDSKEITRKQLAKEVRNALMRGENMHPDIIKRYLDIEMERTPAGPLN